MEECLFCRIVAGEIPARRVFEDDHVVVIRDINPQAPTHVLIIPRQHLASMREIGQADPGLIHHIGLAAELLSRQEGVADTGYRLIVNTGSDGGQTVAHLHVHLLGGRQMRWPPG